MLSNEFFKLYLSPCSQACVKNSISIISHCAETDPIAQRLLFILSSFSDVAESHKGYVPTRRLPVGLDDPIVKYFNSSAWQPTAGGLRRASNASMTFGNNTNPKPMSVLTQRTNLTTKTINPTPVSGDSPEGLQRHGSLEGSDGFAEGEIDFDAFWRLGGQPNFVPGGPKKGETA